MRTYRFIPLYYFYWSLYNYAAHAADILTPTTVVQGVVDNDSWGLYCRRCYCIGVCWGRSSWISHFSRWLGQLSTVLTKDESPHTGYTFTHWVVSFTPPSIEYEVGGVVLWKYRSEKRSEYSRMIKSYYRRYVRLLENLDCCHFRLNQKFAQCESLHKYTNYNPRSCRWLTTEHGAVDKHLKYIFDRRTSRGKPDLKLIHH